MPPSIDISQQHSIITANKSSKTPSDSQTINNSRIHHISAGDNEIMQSSGEKKKIKKRLSRRQRTSKKLKQILAESTPSTAKDNNITDDSKSAERKQKKRKKDAADDKHESKKLKIGETGDKKTMNSAEVGKTKQHKRRRSKRKNTSNGGSKTEVLNNDEPRSKSAVNETIDVVKIDQNWQKLSKKLKVSKKPRNDATSPQPRDAGSTEITKTKKDVWFDDVDEFLLEEGLSGATDDQSKQLRDKLVKETKNTGLTKCLAIDCEMVGVGPGGNESILARVSLVNQYGHCVYDKFVKNREPVTDYRTWVSGVRPEDLETAEEFEVVQKEVAEMVKGRILVGHAIKNDEKVLFLNHPKKFIRDTQLNKHFRNLYGGRKPGLRSLCERLLKIDVQKGEHSSVQDAQATMRLYTLVRKKWEKELKDKYMKRKSRAKLLNAKQQKEDMDSSASES